MEGVADGPRPTNHEDNDEDEAAAANEDDDGEQEPETPPIISEVNDLTPGPKRQLRYPKTLKKHLGYNPDRPHEHQENLESQLDPVKKLLEKEQQAAQQCIGLLDTIIQIMVRACSLLQ